jgi:KduI/IolB family
VIGAVQRVATKDTVVMCAAGTMQGALQILSKRRVMTRLLHKPFGRHGKVHEITTGSADWRYVGFSVWRLRAGETVSEATGDCEVILVMVEGKARLADSGQDWGVPGQRDGRVREGTDFTCRTAPSGRPRPRPTG